MSFIHEDSQLIEQLIQAAISEDKNSISKKGQATPDKDFADSLKALLTNLRSEITPATPKPGEVGRMQGSVDLASPNMDSMGDFVEWLATHKTPVGGVQIVYPGNIPQGKLSRDYAYIKIEPGTEIATVSEPPSPLRPERKAVTETAYWINIPALKQYLVSLQGDPELKGNVMFQVQLLKLIQSANRNLDMAIGEQYKEPEKVPADGDEIDQVPNPLDINNPRASGQANVSLKAVNVKTVPAFNSWLLGNKLSMKNKDGKVAVVRQDGFDQCAFLNALNARSYYNFSYRQDEKSEIAAKYYMKQIAEIAKQMQCRLTSVPGQTTPGQPSGGSRLSPQAVHQLAMLTPFYRDHTDFNEITLFFDTYAKLANKPYVDQMVEQVKSLIPIAEGRMRTPGPTFQLTGAAQRVVDQVKLGQSVPFLSDLQDIISITGRVYLDFISEAQNMLGPQIDQVRSQIYGPQKANLEFIEGAISLLGRGT